MDTYWLCSRHGNVPVTDCESGAEAVDRAVALARKAGVSVLVVDPSGRELVVVPPALLTDMIPAVLFGRSGLAVPRRIIRSN